MKEYVKEYVEDLLKEREKSITESLSEKLIEAGKMALQEIAEYTGLSLSTVRQLAQKLEASR